MASSVPFASTAAAAPFDIDEYMLDGEMTDSSQQDTDSEGQASTAPSTACDLCESLEKTCFICDDLHNTCNLCGQSCIAVDLENAIPELPRDIRSITTKMPEFCESCFAKRDPAELYSRLRPALDDNDLEAGANTIAFEYVGMGYVVDHGYLQIIYPDEVFKASEHRGMRKPEVVGRELGPEKRAEMAKFSPVTKINLMAELADELVSKKRQRRQ
ncbi:hypothetical protein PG993_012559 [Apiospora rasikravindrae]|uniref:Uncharacterized protein n=1 Tax=Apiospora rasikravindrae TaxID=990691 RepID=A0ABR1S2Y6_9PEZI